MVCDICKKADATVYLAKIVGGKLLKANLCESCAKEKGVEASAGFDEDLLVGLGADIKIESPGAQCSVCGFSQADFKKARKSMRTRRRFAMRFANSRRN